MSKKILLSNKKTDVDAVDKSTASTSALQHENENLKRLLQIIKPHIIYDEKLYADDIYKST